MKDSCDCQSEKLHHQLDSRSPVPLKNLTPAEHAVAEKLAADAREFLIPISANDDGAKFMARMDQDLKEMKDLLAATPKSRLDGILAEADKLLSPDHIKLLQTNKGVILGKQYNPKDGYYMQTPIIGDFSCTPDIGPSRIFRPRQGTSGRD